MDLARQRSRCGLQLRFADGRAVGVDHTSLDDEPCLEPHVSHIDRARPDGHVHLLRSEARGDDREHVASNRHVSHLEPAVVRRERLRSLGHRRRRRLTVDLGESDRAAHRLLLSVHEPARDLDSGSRHQIRLLHGASRESDRGDCRRQLPMPRRQPVLAWLQAEDLETPLRVGLFWTPRGSKAHAAPRGLDVDDGARHRPILAVTDPPDHARPRREIEAHARSRPGGGLELRAVAPCRRAQDLPAWPKAVESEAPLGIGPRLDEAGLGLPRPACLRRPGLHARSFDRRFRAAVTHHASDPGARDEPDLQRFPRLLGLQFLGCEVGCLDADVHGPGGRRREAEAAGVVGASRERRVARVSRRACEDERTHDRLAGPVGDRARQRRGGRHSHRGFLGQGRPDEPEDASGQRAHRPLLAGRNRTGSRAQDLGQ